MIPRPAVAAVLAAGLAVPERPALILPKPAIVRPGNAGFPEHVLPAMPLTMGMLKPSSPGTGPYEVLFRGSYRSGNSGSFTTGSINIGPAYTDRIVLVGIYTHNAGTSSVSVGGASATLLDDSAYQDSWWKAVNVPGSSVTVSGSGATTYRTVVVHTVTGASNGSNSVIATVSGSANNNNNVSVSFASCLAGDIMLAIGHKGGTGATDAWGSFGGTAGVTQTEQLRIGTAGDGYGGHGISPPQTSSGTKTITASGSDSSKAISIAALRIRK